MQLYEAEGESPRNAAELILEKNLYGLDIDKRAFQLSYFALMMKARQYNRRILSKSIRPNVFEIPDGFGLTKDDLVLLPMNYPDKEKAKMDLITLVDGFKHGKDLGSLIKFENIDFENLKAGLNKKQFSFDEYDLLSIIHVGEILKNAYHLVITNPPYMGSTNFNDTLSKYSKKYYPNSKSDLFAMFIERWNTSLCSGGYNAMVTMQSWMFLSSYESMRKNIINQFNINTLMHMENMVMGIAFGTAVTIFQRNQIRGFIGTYHQIKTKDVQNDYPQHLPIKGNRFNQISQNEFEKIPGSPISYWVSEKAIYAFLENESVGDRFVSAGRTKTHGNDLYLRFFWEINTQEKHWQIFHNGGNYKNFFGNEEFVINVSETAIHHYTKFGGNQKTELTEKFGITWNLLTSSTNSFRIKEKGYRNSSIAPTLLSKYNSDTETFELLGFLTSVVSKYLINAINPTLATNIADIRKLPFIRNKKIPIFLLSKECVNISKTDWSHFETSKDFRKHPLL